MFAVLAVIFGVVVARDVDRAPDLRRSARTAVTARYSGVRVADRSEIGLFMVIGPDRRAGRRDADRPILECPGRQRQRPRPDSSSRSSFSAASTSTAAGARSRASSSPSSTLAVLQSDPAPASASRASYQSVAIGLLLIVSVVTPNLARQMQDPDQSRARAGRPPPAVASDTSSEEWDTAQEESSRMVHVQFAEPPGWQRSRSSSRPAARPQPQAPASAAVSRGPASAPASEAASAAGIRGRVGIGAAGRDQPARSR